MKKQHEGRKHLPRQRAQVLRDRRTKRLRTRGARDRAAFRREGY